MHNNSNSLPLAVLILGGAFLGYVAAYILGHFLAAFAWIAGPILGALWGWSQYKKPLR